MNRTYTREWYDMKVDRIRTIVPDCAISTDMISGFCSETEEEHEDSKDLMAKVKYDMAYMFFYSERPGTLAQKKFEDDVPLDVKKRRLSEIIAIQSISSLEQNQKSIGKTYEVLIEGVSKKNDQEFKGRTSQNKVVIFPRENYKLADFVKVKINSCSSATMIGEVIEKVEY